MKATLSSCRRLARAVAVLGRDSELRDAADLAKLDAVKATDAADALVAASIYKRKRNQ